MRKTNTRPDTKSAETFIIHRGHQTKFQTSSYNGHLPSLPRWDKYLLRTTFKFPLHIFSSKLLVFNNTWPIRNGAGVAWHLIAIHTCQHLRQHKTKLRKWLLLRTQTPYQSWWKLSTLSVTPTAITRKGMSQRLRCSIRVFAKEHGSRSAKVRLRKPACKAVIFVISSVCTERYRNSTLFNVHLLPDPKQFLCCYSKQTTIS